MKLSSALADAVNDWRTLPSDPAELDALTRRAVRNFRDLQPTLNSFVRILTGKNIPVKMHATSNGHTDGNAIYMRPPLLLGKELRHNRTQCDKRNPDTLQQLCLACAQREHVLTTIYHEISHIWFGTFSSATDFELRQFLESVRKTYTGKYADNIVGRLEQLPAGAPRAFMDLAMTVNEFLPHLLNAVEDARVDKSMAEARRGVKWMQQASIIQALDRGFEGLDEHGAPMRYEWRDNDLNAQLAVAIYSAALGVDPAGRFHDKVLEVFADPEMTRALGRLASARSAAGAAKVTFDMLTIGRNYGFFRSDDEAFPEPEEEIQPEPESGAQDEPQPEPQSSDDNESGEGESSDESDDDGTPSGAESDPSADDAGAPDAPQEPEHGPSGDQSTPGDDAPDSGADDATDDAATDADSADPADGDEDSGDTSDDPTDDSGDPAGPADDGEGDGSEEDDAASGEDADPQGGDSSDADDRGDEGTGSADSSDLPPSDDDSQADDGPGSPDMGDESGTNPGDSSGDGPDADPSADGDTPDADGGSDTGDDDASDNDSGESDGVGSDSDNASGSDLPGAGNPGPAGRGASDHGNIESGDTDGQGDLNDEPGQEAEDGDDDDQGDRQSAEPSDGDSRPGDPSDTDSSESGDAGEPGDRGDAAGDGSSGDDDGRGEPGSPSGEAAGSDDSGDPYTQSGPVQNRAEPNPDAPVGDDEGPGEGDRPDGESPAADEEPGDDEGEVVDHSFDAGQPEVKVWKWGTADDMKVAFEEVSEHDGTDVETGDPVDAMPIALADAIEALMERAVGQIMFFDTSSYYVSGVSQFTYGPDQYGNDAWVADNAQGSITPSPDMYPPSNVPSETIMGPALQRLRRAFADNSTQRYRADLRTGKINTRRLASRAPTGDDRLFRQRIDVSKKDYVALIGLDISGSTSSGDTLQLIKDAARAQAELLSRLGIPFMMYAHSGATLMTGGERARNLAIFTVKDVHQPWDAKAIERLGSLRPTSANLDGHTLEFYRKRLDEVRTRNTRAVLMYYTDGAMPAENFDEELEILQREIKICRDSGYVLVGVGIGNDDPNEHGLETVRIDAETDIIRLVERLRDRILQ